MFKTVYTKVSSPPTSSWITKSDDHLRIRLAHGYDYGCADLHVTDVLPGLASPHCINSFIECHEFIISRVVVCTKAKSLPQEALSCSDIRLLLGTRFLETKVLCP
jgi:hypothetical protein